jgi:hypothetical protein
MLMQFDSKLTNTVDSLRKKRSRGEFIRLAIATLKVAEQAKRNGEKLVMVARDGTRREIVI